jgi:hypothetical protein
MPYINNGTHVTSLGTITVNTMGSTGSGTAYITIANSTDFNNMRDGMSISDGPVSFAKNCTVTPQGIITQSTTITKQVSPPNTIKLSPDPGTSVMNDCFTVSGGNVLFLDTPTAGTGANFTQRVLTGVYRMVGALYTDPSSNVVLFAQDGDTFYLKSSVQDFPSSATGACNAAIGAAAKICRLSVPCGLANTCGTSGIKVEAFGRIVGGTSTNEILLSSEDQTDQAPTLFTAGPPGYVGTNTSPTSAFPFRVYTDTNGRIRVRALSSSTNDYEVTDGWVLHRAQ